MGQEPAYLNASPHHVASFLGRSGVSPTVISLFEAHKIDGLAFALLTDQDLREIQIDEISIRKRLLFLSSTWKQRDSAGRFFVPSPHPDDFSEVRSFFGDFGEQVDHDAIFDPQPSKLLVSALYAFFVVGVTSTVMVLAHERLPNMSKYPPLPDLFLDNIPYISWAFAAAEYDVSILMVIWSIVLLFHRHRFILLRRFFAITGTVFLLRSVTMIITSLSVPGHHLAEHCQPYVFTDHTQRFKRILEIWLGFGMTIHGVHTCGDYMFSGHTSILTLLNFFITEYCPRQLQWMHTFCWVLNLFGVFFILASHEHYSIDVFVAVYVSSRLFLYYHCLANNGLLHRVDRSRTMSWFPMFSYFEYDIKAVVPNVYEWPFGLDGIRGLISNLTFPSFNVRSKDEFSGQDSDRKGVSSVLSPIECVRVNNMKQHIRVRSHSACH